MQLSLLKYKRAFTIIELVIVVTLVGIMAAFVIPNYRGAIDRANEKTASNNLRIIYAAQQMRNNTGGGVGYYYTGGVACAAADTQNINANLNLSILNDGFNYCCTDQSAGGGPKLSCIAFGATFDVLMTNVNTNVCCSNLGGGCPTLPPSVGNPEQCA